MPQTILLPGDPESIAGSPIFLGWSRFALRDVAVRLADRYVQGPNLRLDRVIVALPGGRAGRRLKELLLVEAEARGLRLIPPRIITIGSVPELLYEPLHPFASDALRHRLWMRALRALPAEALTTLLAVPPAPDDLRGWIRQAAIVAGLHQEVAGAPQGPAGGVFEGVARQCAEGLLFADTTRWEVLARVEREYAIALSRLGLSDRGHARIEALRGATLSLEHDLWLVGVVEMPAILRQMLAATPGIADRLTVAVQAPEAEAGAFDRFGTLRAARWASRPIPLRDDQIAVRGRPADQAAEVVRTLAALGGKYAVDEILIGTPNEELVPYIGQAVGAAGAATRAGAGTPIEQTRVYRLLAAVADFLESCDADALAALVRHPDLHASRWLSPLDRYLGETLPSRLEAGSTNPEARGARDVAGLLARLNDELLSELRDTRPLASWMPKVIGLVVGVYERAGLDRSRPSDQLQIAACQRLRQAALDLVAVPAAVDDACLAPTAIRLLLDLVAGEALPPEADPDAIELLGWLELRLDDAPIAVITGFNEPFLPESVNAHAFLPNSLRERLGLADNAQRYARDSYELTALLHSREGVRVIAGLRTAQGDPLRPSRLLFAVQGAALAERVRRFYGEADSTRMAIVAEGGSSRAFRAHRERPIRAEAPIDRISVTSFRQILANPYLFALEHILKLEPLDDGARELDPLGFGNLAHRVLEAFGHSEERGSSDPKVIAGRLDALLDAGTGQWFGAHPRPSVRIQVEQLRGRLHAFARWQARWIGEGWQVVATEAKTDAAGVQVSLGGETIRLTGRIDRIDYHPGRRAVALFDYKTGEDGKAPGEAHRRKKDGAWIDLQLPLYRHLYRHLVDVPATDVLLGYISLPRDLAKVGGQLAAWSEDDLDDADKAAADVLQLLRRNEFSFDPQVTARPDSPFAALLGVGYLESAAESDEGENAGEEGE